MHYLGDKRILENNKVGFLCSRKIPADKILKTYDWALEQRNKGVCVVSGFHSKIEKDVFHYLLKGEQPIIMVLARGMRKKWSVEIRDAVDKKRLLIITPFKNNCKRASVYTTKKRNEFILDLADEVVFGYVTQHGNIHKLVKAIELNKPIKYIK